MLHETQTSFINLKPNTTIAINYAIKRCPNPNGIEGVDYYAPRVIKVDDYTVEELVTDINDATGMSDIDVRPDAGILGELRMKKSLRRVASEVMD